ncbi:MAG: hypothetical protein SGJ19_01575 [Planctomycetia bacterium]|nr:hypothetical protein [Planctomycetia bacterium]
MFARHRQPSGPMWPYIGLLGLLFALSVTAPRAWAPKPRVAAPRPFASAKQRLAVAAASIALPRAETAPVAKSVFIQAVFAGAKKRSLEPAGTAPVRIAMLPAVAPLGLQDDAAPAVTANGLYEPLAPGEIDLPVEPVLLDDAAWQLALADEADDDTAQDEAPVEQLALVPSVSVDEIDVAPIANQPVIVPVSNAWLQPTALLDRLNALASECECGPWALSAAEAVEAFANANPRDLDAAAPALAAVWQRLFEGEALAEEQSRPALATQLRRTCDAMRRRLAVWDAALARLDDAQHAPQLPNDAADLGLALGEVEATLAGRDDAQVWREYLLLDELRAMNASRASLADDAREALAREVLSRLASPSLDLSQRKLVGERRVQRLAGELRGWSEEDECQLDLARRLERFEEDLLPSDAQQLATAARQLAASRDPRDQELSRQLNERFRNANVRLEFSAELISRLLPESAPREQAVEETILGVPNRGHSRTTTRLFFRTANERGRLGLELFAAGDVDSWTTAESGPARFHNAGRAQFSARRRLRFDRRGLHAGEVLVEVDSQTDLQSVRTDFDRLPLIGGVVRKIARRQYDEKRGEAQVEAERRIKEKLGRALMDETETAFAAANVRWRERVITPLDRLGLAPRIIEAGSSDNRALLRVRLAADSQLGSHTPRPRLPGDALLGLQVHQTALNNLLEGLDLNGRTFSLPELGAWLAEKMNRDDLLPKASLRDDVWIHFAEQDAVHARLVDGQVELNLQFAELITTHRSWHNFQVRVKYRPETNSLTADLEREGPVELLGENVGGVELALRGILNRIFPVEEPWHLTPAQLAQNPRLQGLRVTHFVIDDGWLSVAVGEDQAAAKQPRVDVRR